MKCHSVAATLVAVLLCCWMVSINPTASASLIEGEDAASKLALQTVNIVLPMGSEEAWQRVEVDFLIDAGAVAPQPEQEDLLRELDLDGVLPADLQELSAWTPNAVSSDAEELKAKLVLDLEKHSLLLYIGDELVFVGSTMMLAQNIQSDELRLQLHLVPLTEGITTEVPSPGGIALLMVAAATISRRKRRLES